MQSFDLADRLGCCTKTRGIVRSERSSRFPTKRTIEDAGTGWKMFTGALATRQVPFPRTVAFDRAISVGRYELLRFSPFSLAVRFSLLARFTWIEGN